MAAISSTDRSEYEDGSGRGGGGKFRKKPLRRTQITPYDRPSTSLGNSNYSGWLYRKLLDPASKFITSGASRFFASIFLKRLPPPTNRPVTEAKEESTKKIYPTSYSWTVQVEPKFHEDVSNLEQLVPFEECIELRSSDEAVVRGPEYLLLTHNGRSFNIVVGPTNLTDGLHYYELYGLDCKAPWRY